MCAVVEDPPSSCGIPKGLRGGRTQAVFEPRQSSSPATGQADNRTPLRISGLSPALEGRISHRGVSRGLSQMSFELTVS